MYFPYVLMNPILIIAMILGNGVGTLIYEILDVGLVAGPSPGSVFAYLMLTPKGNFFGIILGIAAAALVSFLVASFILKLSKNKDNDLEASIARSQAMKEEGKAMLDDKVGVKSDEAVHQDKMITNVAFACDAGLGSSAMGAGAFRKKLKEKGIEITVKHYAIERVPEEAQVVVTHENLLERAQMALPGKRIVTIKNYLGDPNIDQLLEEIAKQYQ